jgi:hypothetical protein
MQSNNDNNSGPKPQCTKEEVQKMEAQVAITKQFWFATAILVLAPVAYALLNNNIDLAKYQSTTAQNLTETGPDK